MADEQGKGGPAPIRSLADILAGSQPIFTSGSSGWGRQLSPLEQLLYGGAALTPPSPPVIHQRWFKDQTIHIDGYTFELCRFDRCHLITEQATFAFRNCFISPDTAIYFRGPSLKIARLLMHTLRLRGRVVKLHGEEAIFPTDNTDGTFSLAGVTNPRTSDRGCFGRRRRKSFVFGLQPGPNTSLQKIVNLVSLVSRGF